MPIPSDILTRLADALAEVYPDQITARTMAVTAGLDAAHIPFGPTTFTTWVAILQQAEREGCTEDLVQRALAQYASYAPLVQAGGDFTAWVAAGRPDSDLPTGVDQNPTSAGQPASPPATGDTRTVYTSGGAYVGGGVSIGPGGTFVGRDQVTTTTSTQGVSLAEFTVLLADIRRAVAKAGLDEETTAALDADLRLAESQANKPAPNKALLLSRLEGAARLLTAAAGTVTAVDKLLPALQQALAWAANIFR